jgi:hypothetical protein
LQHPEWWPKPKKVLAVEEVKVNQLPVTVALLRAPGMFGAGYLKVGPALPMRIVDAWGRNPVEDSASEAAKIQAETVGNAKRVGGHN